MLLGRVVAGAYRIVAAAGANGAPLRGRLGSPYRLAAAARSGYTWSVILIQRVRVRWTAAARGAPAANARRGLVRAMPPPRSLPDAEVVVHDVLADQEAGYEHRDGVRAGGVALAREVGLWLGHDRVSVVVDRLPGSAAYPRAPASARLFTLAPGQVGRYRANFRFTGCACNPSWYYEEWLVHVCHGTGAAFGYGEPDRDVDHRVRLYGGAIARLRDPPGDSPRARRSE
ncbi:MULTISPECIES: hypothetical protein [Micromonospora]|uniref:hypothetical protein n=1 Tax=Micromonospora TaxID=1873 RepID=UPI001CEC9475|nr:MULTISPECIES: hypothetical protein [Micromonospora]